MNLDETAVRNLCTDAVFDRGVTYHRDERVRERCRIGDAVSARVQGSDLYDVRIETAADSDGIDATYCSCPYDGSGCCKHVVAVALAVAGDDGDAATDFEVLLERASVGELREFARDALLGHPELRDQFRVIVGESPERTTDDVRQAVESLFEEHTEDYPVVAEAIDFSRFRDLAERHRERGEYEQAASVYSGLADGIADNAELVDGSYDHYAQTLTDALDGYVDSISAADPDDRTFEAYAGHLAQRRQSVVHYYAEQYARALDELESRR